MFIPNTHFWVRPIPGNWSMAVEFLTSLLSSVSINNSLKIHVYYIIIIILLTCLRKFVLIMNLYCITHSFTRCIVIFSFPANQNYKICT